MSGPTIDRSTSSGDIWTPWNFIQAIEKRFGPIAWDLAATLKSSKARYAGMHIDEARDSLTVPWHRLETVDGSRLLYLNPPYDHIDRWARKCASEKFLGCEILLLVPMGGQNWYWDYVEPFADVYSIGRLRFDNCFTRGTGEPVKGNYPKDLILAHYYNGSPQQSKMQRWRWNQ